MARKARAPRTGVQRRSAGPRTLDELARDGSAAFRKGDYEAAAKAWREVVRVRHDPRASRALAEALFRSALATGDADDALQRLSEARRLQPDRPALDYHVGLVSLRAGRPGDAVSSLQAAHKRSPDDPRVRFHLALALLRQGAPDASPRALELLDGAAEPHAACLRVAARLRQPRPAVSDEEIPAAAAAAARDLQLAPALVHLSRGDEGKAVETLRALAAESGDPAGVAAAHALGVGAWTRGDAAEAGRCWRAAEASGFPSPELGILRSHAVQKQAMAAAAQGDIETAETLWRQAWRDAPDDARARRNWENARCALADARMLAGDMESAVAVWRGVVADGEAGVDVLRNLALAYEQQGRPEDALPLWAQIIGLWEETPKRKRDDEMRRRLSLAYRHVAELYMGMDDSREAVRVLRDGLRSDPKDFNTRLMLASVYLADGKLGPARTAVEKVLEEQPDRVEALVVRAHLLAGEGDLDGAANLMRDVMARDPKVPGIKEHFIGLLNLKMTEAWEEDDDRGVDRLVEEILALAPTDPAPLIAAGGLALDDKKGRRASQCFDRAVKLKNDAGTLHSIAEAHLEHGRAKDALRWFDRSLKLDDTPDHILAVWAALQEAGAPWRDARRYAEMAAKTTEDPKLLAALAHTALDAGAVDLARDWVARAYEADPVDPIVLVVLASVQLMDGDRGGIETMRRAARQAEAQGEHAMAAELRQSVAFLEAFGGASPEFGGSRFRPRGRRTR